GDQGGRNDTLARFVGGLLSRSVDPECILRLAETANNNSVEPLGKREMRRTIESMIKKHMRGGGHNR
ncbi:TPA: primase C-terminal domain-containing protein, partial [Streptococcus equi subsp. equi]|nr:primase C-terminal domain-containing protein [Streptococcus equi subsp. equi]